MAAPQSGRVMQQACHVRTTSLQLDLPGNKVRMWRQNPGSRNIADLKKRSQKKKITMW